MTPNEADLDARGQAHKKNIETRFVSSSYTSLVLVIDRK